MKKPLSIKSTVFATLENLPRHERAECMLALADLMRTFGQPHIHSGIGIRKLGKGIFECRGNLKLRFLFFDRPQDLYIWFLGNHNEVQAALRSMA